jgi:hypothetical protein
MISPGRGVSLAVKIGTARDLLEQMGDIIAER